jgi:hypothetical protein
MRTQRPRQRWMVSTKDGYALQGNRCRQGPPKALNRSLTTWIIGRDGSTEWPRQRWIVSIKDSKAKQGNRCWQGPPKKLNWGLTNWMHKKRWEQSSHDKGGWLISRTVRRYKVIHADKAHQRHSIEILLAEYRGRDENTERPQRWIVSTKDSGALLGNRCWQGAAKTLNWNLTNWINKNRWEQSSHDKVNC